MLTHFVLGHKMDWTSYHRLEDIYGYLNYVADQYPDLVQLLSIGSSSEGRHLYVVHISSRSGGSNKPAIWIDGGLALIPYAEFKYEQHENNKQYLKQVYMLESGFHQLSPLTSSNSWSRCRATASF